ncbi:hypothetical protein Tco_0345861 [Tanacetum coccineum]
MSQDNVKMKAEVSPNSKHQTYQSVELYFEKTSKKRITPTGITEGERGFEQTKTCYLTEVIPFFKTLQEHFEGIQKAITKEVKEMSDAFDELETELDQSSVDRKHDEIELKNLLIEHDNIIAEGLSKEVFYAASNSELNVSRFTEMQKLIMFYQSPVVWNLKQSFLIYVIIHDEVLPNLLAIQSLQEQIMVMASAFKPLELRPGPGPNLLTPGPISSGLVPNPAPAIPYLPPTNKELEIPHQVIPTATGPSVSIAIDLDVPSGSHTSSPLDHHSSLVHHGVAGEQCAEVNPFAAADPEPFVNVFASDYNSEASSSGEMTIPESNPIPLYLMNISEMDQN